MASNVLILIISNYISIQQMHVTIYGFMTCFLSLASLKTLCVIGSGPSGSLVYSGMDSTTGQLTAVHQWDILLPTQSSIVTLAEKDKLEKYWKTISTIEHVSFALKLCDF